MIAVNALELPDIARGFITRTIERREEYERLADARGTETVEMSDGSIWDRSDFDATTEDLAQWVIDSVQCPIVVASPCHGCGSETVTR